MFGQNRIRCKIVNYSDGAILQLVTDDKRRKKFIIGNIKDCKKDKTIFETTAHKAQRIANQLNRLYNNDVWVVIKADDPFED